MYVYALHCKVACAIVNFIIRDEIDQGARRGIFPRF